jgi:hypothetical protein
VNATKKTIGILQPGYLPWLGFFDQVASCDVFVLYDDVQFDKHGWRNRNRIKAANGAQWITVPVLHKGLGNQLIKDVKINYTENWIDKHIKMLTQNYAKSLFFDKYSPDIFDCLNKKYEYLADLDIALAYLLRSFLNLATPIVRSSSIRLEGDRIQRLVQCIKYFDGTDFIEGDAGKAYITKEEFAKQRITIHYQEYKHPVYNQLYPPFVPKLSILDLLFNCGNASLEILKSKGGL